MSPLLGVDDWFGWASCGDSRWRSSATCAAAVRLLDDIERTFEAMPPRID